MTTSTSTSTPDPSTPIVVTITLTASSPTLSLSTSDETEPFHLITTATQTTTSPLTLHTGRFPASVTALATWPNGAPRYGNDQSSPALQGNAIRALVQVVDSDGDGDGDGDGREPSHGTASSTGNSGAQQQRRAKTIEWEAFRVNWVPPPNMRQDPAFTWATIPAAPGQLVIKHFLSRAKLMESGVRPGEVYETGLNARRSNACPKWWTYGSLATDLKEKKFGRPASKDRQRMSEEECEEWVGSLEGVAGKLVLEHGEEMVRIEVVE